MNGPQDLGGRDGFGAVRPEADEPLFHAAWEARALGITLAAGALGYWTLDESRHARESLPPPVYYQSSYYEIWIRALEVLLQRHDLIEADDLAAGDAAPGPAHPKRLDPARVPDVLTKGGPTDRPLTAAPRFAPGDRVVTRLQAREGHTRLPTYLAGRPGVIEADHGGHVFPDTNAHGGGEQPQRLYTVVFQGADLWGADAEPGSTVSADLWESYLERA